MADSGGSPRSGSATATVAIAIQDVNDNNPVLENPHPNAFELLEVSWPYVVWYQSPSVLLIGYICR